MLKNLENIRWNDEKCLLDCEESFSQKIKKFLPSAFWSANHGMWSQQKNIIQKLEESGAKNNDESH